MFKKILIANRGEIAMRIIRACRELNIATAAIYSEADSTGIYVKKADEAYQVGPGPVKGFLDMQQIVDLALRIGADAIHPGYGFLSENAQFAQLCQVSGITFIGPSPQVIHLMGSKVKARELAKKVGVPIVPGTDEAVMRVEEGLAFAHSVGYPVMIKASAGGGGRGLRVVRTDTELRNNMETAAREALAAFGDGSIFLEKYIERPHHIEFQILGDKHGHVIHLGERDCSVQRRHQKLIEIAPSLILTPELRREMGEAAAAIAHAVSYDNAGTVEFLLDQNRRFYFIEMNPRIQVEHTVTEQITAVDIVRSQISIAAGQPLEFKQEDVTLQGHAIQCRINAEDPRNNFRHGHRLPVARRHRRPDRRRRVQGLCGLALLRRAPGQAHGARAHVGRDGQPDAPVAGGICPAGAQDHDSLPQEDHGGAGLPRRTVRHLLPGLAPGPVRLRGRVRTGRPGRRHFRGDRRL
jgi:pyruvate carboxylase subunit A